MTKSTTYLATALTIIMIGAPHTAFAQDLSGDLDAYDIKELRSIIEPRYDAALAVTRDGGVVSADDPRYMWASEAKVQCAIALGYLKSRTRDETSIRKCDYAYGRMSVVTQVEERQPAVIPPPPPPRNAACDDRQPTLVFFD